MWWAVLVVWARGRAGRACGAWGVVVLVAERAGALVLGRGFRGLGGGGGLCRGGRCGCGG